MWIPISLIFLVIPTFYVCCVPYLTCLNPHKTNNIKRPAGWSSRPIMFCSSNREVLRLIFPTYDFVVLLNRKYTLWVWKATKSLHFQSLWRSLMAFIQWPLSVPLSVPWPCGPVDRPHSRWRSWLKVSTCAWKNCLFFLPPATLKTNTIVEFQNDFHKTLDTAIQKENENLSQW